MTAAAASTKAAETTAVRERLRLRDRQNNGCGGRSCGCGVKGAPIRLTVLQTAVRQYRQPALAVSSCFVLRALHYAGGRLSSAHHPPVGISIDQLPHYYMMYAN